MPTLTVYIVSGEGTGPGTTETYTGTLSGRAIRARLKKERAGGDRWAYAMVETDTTHPRRVHDDDLDRLGKSGRPTTIGARKGQVSLDEESWAKARALGDGNASAGIRLALSRVE